MKKFCPHQTAFTLIELLVVTSIMGILFTLGIAAYNNFNRNQILGQAAKTLRNDLRLVQSKASSGEMDCSTSACGGTTDGCGNDIADGTEKTFEGWFISFANSPDPRYAFYGKCGGTTFGTKYINLPSGVTFDPMPAYNPVQFSPISRGASADVTITLKSNSGTQTVTITKSGGIN